MKRNAVGKLICVHINNSYNNGYVERNIEQHFGLQNEYPHSLNSIGNRISEGIYKENQGLYFCNSSYSS